MRESLAPGVWGVVATPFQGSTLDVDTDSLAGLVEYYESIGATGLTVLGVFGEAAALTAAERSLVLEVAVEETGTSPRGGRDLAVHRHRRRGNPRGAGGGRRAPGRRDGAGQLRQPRRGGRAPERHPPGHRRQGGAAGLSPRPAASASAPSPSSTWCRPAASSSRSRPRPRPRPWPSRSSPRRSTCPCSAASAARGCWTSSLSGAAGAMTGFSCPEALIACCPRLADRRVRGRPRCAAALPAADQLRAAGPHRAARPEGVPAPARTHRRRRRPRPRGTVPGGPPAEHAQSSGGSRRAAPLVRDADSAGVPHHRGERLMDLGISGKTALVAASTGGLGLAIARALAAEGVRVAVTGRRLDRAKEIAADLEADGHSAVGIEADLSTPDGRGDRRRTLCRSAGTHRHPGAQRPGPQARCGGHPQRRRHRRGVRAAGQTAPRARFARAARHAGTALGPDPRRRLQRGGGSPAQPGRVQHRARRPWPATSRPSPPRWRWTPSR